VSKIILITGGQRSGKSSYAQQLALSLSANPIYLATSAIWDDEHRERIERHKRDRGPEWTNFEELMDIQNVAINRQVVLLDCLTLWATNFFSANDGQVQACLDAMITRFDAFAAQDATIILVTNEIGLGGISVNDLQRRFTDLIGWLNQYVASKADEVVLMVSGIAVKVK